MASIDAQAILDDIWTLLDRIAKSVDGAAASERSSGAASQPAISTHDSSAALEGDRRLDIASPVLGSGRVAESYVGLSRQQREVVVLFAAGRSYAEVAAALSCKESTVKTQLRRVRQKCRRVGLACASRPELAVLIEQGLR